MGADHGAENEIFALYSMPLYVRMFWLSILLAYIVKNGSFWFTGFTNYSCIGPPGILTHFSYLVRQLVSYICILSFFQ